MTWEFWIDRGGTFTDCIGQDPAGELHTFKMLSSDSAPVECIRAILERAGAIAIGSDAPLPACRVRLGTTVATNALLERRGARMLLIANRGLGDIIEIGTQQRPDLFALEIEKPRPLHCDVVEVGGRVGIDGEEFEALDLDRARRDLSAARKAGIESVAIALIHAYAHPAIENELRALAEDLGFDYVSVSHEVAREMGLLARSETTAVDAYLTPLLRNHLKELSQALPGSVFRFMQSSGGLTDAARFRGPTALLSGPAGGVVGAARVAAAAGFETVLGFDMGGTSTDVSLIRAGEVERCFETVVGGVRIKAPMMRVHTVAAGGGSLCRFDGIRLLVGPESASAVPGPLCYGRPDARDLTLTDCNVSLGRVQPDRFPFALKTQPIARALDQLGGELEAEGHKLDRDGVAAGFVEVANASMAHAIAEVSVARGVDPRDCALVGFGGAAGQHVCAIARELGIREILLHPFAGILSAYGMGAAAVSWDGQRDAGRVSLPSHPDSLPQKVLDDLAELEEHGRAALTREGIPARSMRAEPLLDLRYAGTETALSVRAPHDGDFLAAFAAQHQTQFGYTRPNRSVEIVTARVRVSSAPPEEPPGAKARADDSMLRAAATPPPLREARVWFPGVGRVAAAVFAREALAPGAELRGPALILEDTGTIVLDPGFVARLGVAGILTLSDESGAPRAEAADFPRAEAGDFPRAEAGGLSRPDPIRLEVFGNRFMSIAERMGAVLRNTSVSTNIKERLDYSCAVFDGQGGLVANAPHIPVHLGAMAETVRRVRADFPRLARVYRVGPSGEQK